MAKTVTVASNFASIKGELESLQGDLSALKGKYEAGISACEGVTVNFGSWQDDASVKFQSFFTDTLVAGVSSISSDISGGGFNSLITTTDALIGVTGTCDTLQQNIKLTKKEMQTTPKTVRVKTGTKKVANNADWRPSYQGGTNTDFGFHYEDVYETQTNPDYTALEEALAEFEEQLEEEVANANSLFSALSSIAFGSSASSGSASGGGSGAPAAEETPAEESTDDASETDDTEAEGIATPDSEITDETEGVTSDPGEGTEGVDFDYDALSLESLQASRDALAASVEEFDVIPPEVQAQLDSYDEAIAKKKGELNGGGDQPTEQEENLPMPQPIPPPQEEESEEEADEEAPPEPQPGPGPSPEPTPTPTPAPEQTEADDVPAESEIPVEQGAQEEPEIPQPQPTPPPPEEETAEPVAEATPEPTPTEEPAPAEETPAPTPTPTPTPAPAAEEQAAEPEAVAATGSIPNDSNVVSVSESGVNNELGETIGEHVEFSNPYNNETETFFKVKADFNDGKGEADHYFYNEDTYIDYYNQSQLASQMHAAAQSSTGEMTVMMPVNGSYEPVTVYYEYGNCPDSFDVNVNQSWVSESLQDPNVTPVSGWDTGGFRNIQFSYEVDGEWMDATGEELLRDCLPELDPEHNLGHG